MASLQTLLTQLNNGGFMHDASDRLTELVRAIGETGKAGSLTLKISARPTQGKASALVFAAKVTAAIPAVPPDATLMFSNADGDLFAEDPRQMKLDLRQVNTAPPVLKSQKAS